MKKKIKRWTNTPITPSDKNDSEEVWLRFICEACKDDAHGDCIVMGVCRHAVANGGGPGHCRTSLARCRCIEINIEADIAKEE